MHFTREPIIETVITARDGHRIVVRNSKNQGQEEFFVDALEVISFQSACFYRSLERPKSFILPISDYEVLEVRESRLPLKAASFEASLRSASSMPPRGEGAPSAKASIAPQRQVEREIHQKELSQREPSVERREGESRREQPQVTRETIQQKEKQMVAPPQNPVSPTEVVEMQAEVGVQEGGEGTSAGQRRRDRRKNVRRRRGAGRGDGSLGNGEEGGQPQEPSQQLDGQFSEAVGEEDELPQDADKKRQRGKKPLLETGQETSATPQSSTMIGAILPPPTTLIRDELARMRNNELYKGAFYLKEESEQSAEVIQQQKDGVVVPEEKPEERFIVSSTLQFDDEDDMQSDAYKATPTAVKKRSSSQEENS